MVTVDKEVFLESLGGEEAAGKLDSEARADAIEDFLAESVESRWSADRPVEWREELSDRAAGGRSDRNQTVPHGRGSFFTSHNGNVKKLPPMPANPTLADYFELRFGTNTTRNHCLQSATLAMKNGMTEEIILACLLHDTAAELMRSDHGWWGGQLYEPYVPEKVAFAIRYHQTLRFYPDKETGNLRVSRALPVSVWRRLIVPAPHVEAAYKMLRNHKWYMEPRLVTLNDLWPV